MSDDRQMSNLLPSIIQARSFVHFFHFFFPFFSLSSSSASTTSSCSYEYQETSISKQLFRFRSELVSRFPRRRCTTSCIHTQETQRYKTFFTHFAVRLSDERATNTRERSYFSIGPPSLMTRFIFISSGPRRNILV